MNAKLDSTLQRIFEHVFSAFHHKISKAYIQRKVREALDWFIKQQQPANNFTEFYDFDKIMDAIAYAFGNEFTPTYYEMLKGQYYTTFQASRHMFRFNYHERQLFQEKQVHCSSNFLAASFIFNKPSQIHTISIAFNILMEVLPYLFLTNCFCDESISLESTAKVDKVVKDVSDYIFFFLNLNFLFSLIQHRSLNKISLSNALQIKKICQLLVDKRDKYLFSTLPNIGLDKEIMESIRFTMLERTFKFQSKLASSLIALGKREAAILTLDVGRTVCLQCSILNEISDTWKMIKESKEEIRLAEISKQLNELDKNATVLVYHIDFHGILHCCVLNGEVALVSFSQLDEKDLISKIQMLVKPCNAQVRREFSFVCQNNEQTGLSNNTSSCPDVRSRKPKTNTSTPQSTLQRATLRLKQLNAKWAAKYLYQILLQPVKKCIKFKSNKLIIIPDQSLFFLPFSSLLDENDHALSKNYSIQIVPTLHFLLSSLINNPDCISIGPAMFVENPKLDLITRDGNRLANPPSSLPYASLEVQQLAALFNTSAIVEDNATKSMVFLNLEKVSILHIASHGDPTFGWIYFAPDFNLVTPVDDEQEAYMLREHDLTYLCQTRARLVFLSCCNTARGWVSSNGVFGIARAFLACGARSVVVSLWPIDDLITRDFTYKFYTFICEGRSACESLQLTMVYFQTHHNPNYRSYTSWAAFQVLGEDIRFTREEIEEIHKLGVSLN